MARASLCTVLHVEGLVPVVAARASPCTLHVEGLVTVFAARASPCTLHVGELVTVFAARASFSPSERLGGRVPSLCGDTKCVPSLSGDTKSMPQRIAGMVVHLEDGVDSTLRVSLLGRYTEGQEMSAIPYRYFTGTKSFVPPSRSSVNRTSQLQFSLMLSVCQFPIPLQLLPNLLTQNHTGSE